jgi:lysozyme family protein
MDNLVTLNQKRWDNCHVSAEKGPQFQAVANRLTAPAAKARYQAVEKKTGVPWWFIAVVHEREASQNWNTQLGQGDPLNRKSTHKPAGRGPFSTWEDGAVDALVNCPPYAARNKDWSVGGALTMLEKYNGLGYAGKGLPSPYVWAGTDQYIKGKYTSDGKYNPNVVDSQLGCAGLLKFMGVFKQGVGASTAAAGAVVAAGGTAVASTPQHYWPWIIAGTIITAIIAFVVFEVYEFKARSAVTPAPLANKKVIT